MNDWDWEEDRQAYIHKYGYWRIDRYPDPYTPYGEVFVLATIESRNSEGDDLWVISGVSGIKENLMERVNI
jgi:hypothetical protein